MRKTSTVAICCLPLFFLLSSPLLSQAIIIDHTCTDLSQVPENYSNAAKNIFRISYGHTSHGSQIVSGMENLYNQYGSLYAYNYGGTGGALSFHDYEPDGDLGNPDRVTWYSRTRTLLNTLGNDRNMIMWSWCGQVSDATQSEIADDYLALMNQLENDYPAVRFIYMTGHLDIWSYDNLKARNQQIRDYCIANGKILFDFADIESYDPSGTYYEFASDDCGYYLDSTGNTELGNWGTGWCAATPGSDLCASCSCAHSQALNCNLKGRAFWWMMARLAGWDPTPSPPGTAPGDYNGDGTTDIALFRPAAGLWAVKGVTRAYFGSLSDDPAPGDYDGDGTTEIALFRGGAGLWAVRGVTRRYFGGASDQVAPADYNGDGTCDIGIFRGYTGLWAVPGVTRFYYGTAGDIPCPGNYGGGSTVAALYRSSEGLWVVRGRSRVYFGGSVDLPVPADYNGGGGRELGIFRSSTGLWSLRGLSRIYFGENSDLPVPGDYHGTGTEEIGVFRSSTGLWAIPGVTRTYFGSGGDIPVTR